jgi:mannosyl-oligosaccharide alpha-1,2-mannosidase
MLGGAALERSDIFEFGLDILEGCWHTYNATPTGIGPEGTTLILKIPSVNGTNAVVWKWKSNDTNDEPHTQISRNHWDTFGFWSTNRGYYLRPGTSVSPSLPLPPLPTSR